MVDSNINKPQALNTFLLNFSIKNSQHKTIVIPLSSFVLEKKEDYYILKFPSINKEKFDKLFTLGEKFLEIVLAYSDDALMNSAYDWGQLGTSLYRLHMLDCVYISNSTFECKILHDIDFILPERLKINNDYQPMTFFNHKKATTQDIRKLSFVPRDSYLEPCWHIVEYSYDNEIYIYSYKFDFQTIYQNTEYQSFLVTSEKNNYLFQEVLERCQ